MELSLPASLRITALFLSLLVRSGIEILARPSEALLERPRPPRPRVAALHAQGAPRDRRPDCYIAHEMNGAPLPIEHGAPARLRLETAVGFKMVKFLDRIDLVADPTEIGEGQGGWREDVQHYGRLARI